MVSWAELEVPARDQQRQENLQKFETILGYTPQYIFRTQRHTHTHTKRKIKKEKGERGREGG